MSHSTEVSIEFGEIPVIHTIRDLQIAAGCLAVSHYACVLDLEEEYVQSLQAEFPTAEDCVLAGLWQALAEQVPDFVWDCDSPLQLRGDQRGDVGLHGDPMHSSEIVSIGYHKTKRHEGGFEATFGIATPRYTEQDNANLTALLRQGETDPRLAVPGSFRRVKLPEGGLIAMTYVYPHAPPQLHDFRTTTASRTSTISILDGYRRGVDA